MLDAMCVSVKIGVWVNLSVNTLNRLGIIGWLLMALNVFTGLGAFEFYTGIQVLQNIPTYGQLAFLIAGLLFVPYFAYRKQGKTVEALGQQLKSKTVQEVFVIHFMGYEFGAAGDSGYPLQSDVRRIIRIQLGITALPSKRVESLQLELLGNTINTDWQPSMAGNLPSGEFRYFDIPDSIAKGTYTVKLIAFAEGKRSESKPYEIEIPE